jgi:vacuolar-type H+-ATPase subunit H
MRDAEVKFWAKKVKDAKDEYDRSLKEIQDAAARERTTLDRAHGEAEKVRKQAIVKLENEIERLNALLGGLQEQVGKIQPAKV